MKTTKLFMTFAVFVGAAAYACAESASTAAAPADITMSQAIMEIMNSKTDQERDSIFQRAQKVRPQSIKDVEDLIGIAKAKKSPRERSFALDKLNTTPENPTFSGPFVRALDGEDRELRTVAIRKLRNIKYVDSMPKIRQILSGYSVVKFKATKLVDRNKARSMVAEGGEAALFLADFQDQEGLKIILNKIEGLEAGGVQALARYGKMALPDILKLARDKNTKDYGAGALSSITDKNAEDDLIRVAADKNESKPIRLFAVHSLTKGIKSDKLINRIDESTKLKKDDPILDMAVVACSDIRTDKAVKVLIEILVNLQDEAKEDNRLWRQLIIGKMEDINNPLTVPVLEKQLSHPDANTRQMAAMALKKITGKDYDWKEPR